MKKIEKQKQKKLNGEIKNIQKFKNKRDRIKKRKQRNKNKKD